MTTNFSDPLGSVKIASPCSMGWDEMTGNERQRHCDDCDLDVYNLSGMTKQEAVNLINAREGRLCVRFYRRDDGTIITQDCPVGWAAVKRRVSKFWAAAASIFITAVSGFGIAVFSYQSNSEVLEVEEVPIKSKSLPLFNIEPRTLPNKQAKSEPTTEIARKKPLKPVTVRSISTEPKTPKKGVLKEKRKYRERVGMLPKPIRTPKKPIDKEPKVYCPVPVVKPQVVPIVRPTPRKRPISNQGNRPEMGEVAVPTRKNG